MDLPNEIRLFNTTYKITYHDEAHEVCSKKEKRMRGEVSHQDCTIRVHKENRPYPEIIRTVWHELLHAVQDQIRGWAFFKDEDSEEHFIDLCSLAIVNILTQNKMCFDPDHEIKPRVSRQMDL